METKMKHALSRLVAAAATLTLSAAAAVPAFASDIELTVQADRPGDTISRYLYGQFAEHLGRGIYEGIWVGEDSEVPNTNGYRDDVIAALKKLEIPVIRWPGGCFADEYNWRDGIGPRKERPVRINTHWGWVEETNAFGTHEFMTLVEMLGSEAYIAGNVGSGTPREMAQWLEYMTADGDTELAKLRRANGREEPWKVSFWGVGNETWGCGGHMTPAHYTHVYKRYATFLKAPEGNRPKRVASGGSNEDTEWTEALSSGAPTWMMNGISHHYYTLPTGNWPKKGNSTGFPEEEWISTLRNTMEIDNHLAVNEAVLDEHDTEGRIGIYLDEWGTWYDPEEGHEPGFLYQQNTIRDAVVAALNFNIFHRHTRRLHMANIAQTVNVLQAVVLTEGDRMIVTPTYHAFEMYRPFMDATFIPVETGEIPEYSLGDVTVPALSVTAAKTAEGALVLGLVNLDPNEAASIVAGLGEFSAGSAAGRTLTADTIDGHNSFDDPEAVKPAAIETELRDGKLVLELPAKSVTVVTLRP
jgi:alpha-N-arabinofuranosidase